MEGAGNNLELVFAAEFYEVDGVAGNSYGELRVVFGVFHCVEEHLAIENVYVEMVGAFGEVAVHHADEVFNAFFVRRTEALRDNAEGVRDAVLTVAIAQFGN